MKEIKSMTDPCKARDPTVINNALIEKCIDLQYPKGELGRLARQEGIPKEEIEEIRFESMFILKIDHLWVMKSLTKLALNNNYIEKLENLEVLIHLRELDMSFNKIGKIENLETLSKLEKITFYENLIETVEGLDTQTKLRVFSIGKNRIADRVNVQYFRRFELLTSLNMAGNPCTEEEDFRIYLALFLPQLVYYEYKKLEDNEREEGLNKFKPELKALKKAEAIEKEENEAIEKERSDAELHAKSFVEYLNSNKLFDAMFENDPEGSALLDIGEDVTEIFDEYKQQFIDYCHQVFNIGEKHHTIRETEIAAFTSGVEAAKDANQKESIDEMEKFLDEKAATFNRVKELENQVLGDNMTMDEYNPIIDDLFIKFKDVIHDTWKILMKLELQMYEQLEDVLQNFEQTMTDMINNFIEESQAVFSQIRAAEVSFSENLSDAAQRYQTNINMNPDFEVPGSLKTIMVDRDAVANAIASSHDVHMQVIDNREDTLLRRARNWLENLCSNIVNDEIKRNRYKILEISHFLDIQLEEFEEVSTIFSRIQAIDTSTLFLDTV